MYKHIYIYMHINHYIYIYTHQGYIKSREKYMLCRHTQKAYTPYICMYKYICLCVCTIIQQGRRQARMPRVLYLDVRTVVTFEHWLEKDPHSELRIPQITLSWVSQWMQWCHRFGNPSTPTSHNQSLRPCFALGTRLASALPLVSGRPWSFLQLSCGGWFRLPFHRGEDLQGKVWL